MTFDTPITTEEVAAISFASGDLTVFIEVSNVMISDHLADKEISAAALRLIALYLAAHFAFLAEGQVKSEKIGASSTSFNMSTGLALLSTTFGQQAIMLDSSGTLSALNSSAASATKENIKYAGSIEII